MKKWIFLAAIFIACILEITALNYFRIFSVKPNLLLAGVVIAGLIFESKWAVLFGLFSGILKDIFALYAFGFNTLAFGLWGLLVARLTKKIKADNNLMRCILVFIVTLLNAALTKLVFVYLDRSVALGIFFRIAFIEVIYTLAASFFIFRIFRPIFQ